MSEAITQPIKPQPLLHLVTKAHLVVILHKLLDPCSQMVLLRPNLVGLGFLTRLSYLPWSIQITDKLNTVSNLWCDSSTCKWINYKTHGLEPFQKSHLTYKTNVFYSQDRRRKSTRNYGFLIRVAASCH